MLDGEILDLFLSSSPLPQHKGKQKAKDVEVIELTDDDDDSLSHTLELFSSPPPASSKKITVIDLDASSDDAELPVKTRDAAATLTQSHPDLQRHQVIDAERELTHFFEKYNGNNGIAGGSNMGNAGGEPSNSSRNNPVPGPSTSDLDWLLEDPPAKKPQEVPPPAPPPLLETPEETMSRYVAQVLEIIPDVDPDHCATLVANHFPTLEAATVEHVLHLLFEDVNYPKVKKLDKGKRKADSPATNDRPNKKARKSEDAMWLSLDRTHLGGPDYPTLALVRVQLL